MGREAGQARTFALLGLALLAAPAAAQLPMLPGLPAAPYHSYETLTADLQALADAHPELARLQSVGESRLGRAVWALEITDFREAGAELLPSVIVVAGQRGDAPASVEAAWIFARDLVEDATPGAADLLRARHVWVVPLANPDGHELGARTNAALVDLERNYPFHWAERGAGPQGTPDYPGPGPASEPETRAVMALLDAQRPSAFVALDGGAPALVQPFGHAPAEPVPDAAVYGALTAWARDHASLDARAPDASGSSLDWAYGAQGLFSAGISVPAPAALADGEPAM
ncbi:MAG TPA: M14 family zinc carboxypeptidase, partial [Candidatus Thermoplasmatota archaeon]|nr:M14 family zinc carboxypeptidase [Candidatus Thermoplasmatota archaeon]